MGLLQKMQEKIKALKEEKDKTTTKENDVISSLSTIIRQQGKEILKDGNKLYSFLTDFIPDKKRELKIIKILCDKQIPQLFLNILSIEDINDLIYKLENEEFIDHHAVVEAVTWFISALNSDNQSLISFVKNDLETRGQLSNEKEEIAKSQDQLQRPNEPDTNDVTDKNEIRKYIAHKYSQFWVFEEEGISLKHVKEKEKQGQQITYLDFIAPLLKSLSLALDDYSAAQTYEQLKSIEFLAEAFFKFVNQSGYLRELQTDDFKTFTIVSNFVRGMETLCETQFKPVTKGNFDQRKTNLLIFINSFKASTLQLLIIFQVK